MKCSFVPYEGDDKYIFVSYSHKDGDSISPILEYLNKEGFRIWYDEGIEWGTEWPESIALHLRNCEVCMAFHSKTSAVSPNCRQEINYALKTRKNILSVYLEDVELSGGMDMQLTSYQSTFPYQYTDLEEFLARLITTNILQCCKVNGTTSEKDEKTENSAEFQNFDAELNENFKRIFDTSKEKQEKLTLQQKLSDIKGKNFFSLIEERLKKDEVEKIETDEFLSLIPDEYNQLFEEDTGKHFVIPDIPGYKTAVFQIFNDIDYKTLTETHSCELLPHVSEETTNDSEKSTTYFIDFVHVGNQIVILHLNAEKNEVFVNMGFFEDNVIKMSKKPLHLKLDQAKISFDDDMSLSTSLYNLDDLTEEDINQINHKNEKHKEVTRETVIGDALAIIIDVETALPVQRELFFDESCGKWKAKIKMTSDKSYFVFQIHNEGENSVRRTLTDSEIAEFYKNGTYGFPKDVVKAIEYFEKDGSAFSLYEIATLFRTEKEIYDEDLYLTYMQQAIEEGCEEAAIDLLLNEVFSSNGFSQENFEVLNQLKERIDLKDFIIGYFTEKNVIEGGFEAAFKHYYDSAMLGFKPAKARIKLKDETNSHEMLFQKFISDFQNDEWLSDYCMGCFLAFRTDIFLQKEKGKELLEKSARSGNIYSAEALFCIFEEDEDYQNEIEALKWLKVIAKDNSHLMNKLGNRLLDGVGCEVSEANDKLAFEAFQKAAERGNETAKHNLGWMYKNGRGCQIDYNKALQLFKEAERINSFYYIGDMYEHGLGVVADIDAAIQYYKKAADEGNKKAINRLKEIKE